MNSHRESNALGTGLFPLLAAIGAVLGAAGLIVGSVALARSYNSSAPTTGVAATTEAGVVLPNVVGETKSQASASLQDLGLSVASTTVHGVAGPSGVVVAEQPNAGARLNRGTLVTLTVSG
jgi:hypothetical protein